MVKHEKDGRNEANFYPVDGIRGHCECGHYFHYIGTEGEITCSHCGKKMNVYVEYDEW